MAITKQQLKSIVKECLVEILSEGIGPETKQSIYESSIKGKKSIDNKNMQQQMPRRGQNVKYTQALAETIKRESNGNSVMASILADTAKNTLPSMLNESKHAQPPVPVNSFEGAVARHTPEELFGEDAASKWAELAFAETPKKF
jgi:hypothetical protein